MVFEHEPFIIKQNNGAPDPQHPPHTCGGQWEEDSKKNKKKKKISANQKSVGVVGVTPLGSKSFFKTEALT